MNFIVAHIVQMKRHTRLEYAACKTYFIAKQVIYPKKNTQAHAHASQYGGANRIRTGGLVIANHALYQLSYSPTNSFAHSINTRAIHIARTTKKLVELTGFEPVAS
jgi:hypothetical protein